MVVLTGPGAAEDAYYPPPDIPALRLPAEHPHPLPDRGYGVPATPADYSSYGHSSVDHAGAGPPSRYSALSPVFRNSGNSADGDGK